MCVTASGNRRRASAASPFAWSGAPRSPGARAGDRGCGALVSALASAGTPRPLAGQSTRPTSAACRGGSCLPFPGGRYAPPGGAPRLHGPTRRPGEGGGVRVVAFRVVAVRILSGIEQQAHDLDVTLLRGQASARRRSSASAPGNSVRASATRPRPAAAARVSTFALRRASASAASANPKARAVSSGEVQAPVRAVPPTRRGRAASRRAGPGRRPPPLACWRRACLSSCAPRRTWRPGHSPPRRHRGAVWPPPPRSGGPLAPVFDAVRGEVVEQRRSMHRRVATLN